jgi:hypothetical protein
MTPTQPNPDEEQIALLLSELRDPPDSWLEAAKQLPRARAEVANIIERAHADASYRERVLADLEAALEREGHGVAQARIAALRAGLMEPGSGG